MVWSGCHGTRIFTVLFTTYFTKQIVSVWAAMWKKCYIQLQRPQKVENRVYKQNSIFVALLTAACSQLKAVYLLLWLVNTLKSVCTWVWSHHWVPSHIIKSRGAEAGVNFSIRSTICGLDFELNCIRLEPLHLMAIEINGCNYDPCAKKFLYTQVWFEQGMWKMFLVVVVRSSETSAWNWNETFCSTLTF